MKPWGWVLDHYLLISNVLMLLSYLQTKLLLFRMICISASIFMCFFVMDLPVISIDNFLFQIIFVCINIYESIPLFKELIPPDFNPEQKELYKKYFKRYLKPVEFKYLLSKHRRKVYKVSSSVVNRGNGFTSLFFVSKIPKDAVCNIYLKKGKTIIIDIHQYSWIGIVEYIHVLNEFGGLKKALSKFETGMWEVDCEISLRKGIEKVNQKKDDARYLSDSDDDKSLEEITNGVIIYEWDLESLQEVFQNKSFGKSIKDGLHSVWLMSSSNLLHRLDETRVNKIESTFVNLSEKSISTLKQK